MRIQRLSWSISRLSQLMPWRNALTACPDGYEAPGDWDPGYLTEFPGCQGRTCDRGRPPPCCRRPEPRRRGHQVCCRLERTSWCSSGSGHRSASPGRVSAAITWDWKRPGRQARLRLCRGERLGRAPEQFHIGVRPRAALGDVTNAPSHRYGANAVQEPGSSVTLARLPALFDQPGGRLGLHVNPQRQNGWWRPREVMQILSEDFLDLTSLSWQGHGEGAGLGFFTRRSAETQATFLG